MIKILFVCHGKTAKDRKKCWKIGGFLGLVGKVHLCFTYLYSANKVREKIGVGFGKVMDNRKWLSHFYIIFDDSRYSDYNIIKMDKYKKLNKNGDGGFENDWHRKRIDQYESGCNL